MFNMPDMRDIMRLAQSPAGQQLFALLQNTDKSAMEAAAAQASAGNYDAARKALSSFLSTPEAQKLLKQMEGQR